MRAAGAERVMLAHPDLSWERPPAPAQASMSPQDLDNDFQAFMGRIDRTFSHPGVFYCKISSDMYHGEEERIPCSIASSTLW